MKVSDIMTKNVVKVGPSDSVLTAATLLTDGNFDGLPVVDDKGTLVGLVTQSNLVTKESHIHIPTLLALLKRFDLYRKDKKFIGRELEGMEGLAVSEVMNPEPPLIYEGESVERAIMQLSRIHGVNPTSVVSKTRVLVGVITRYDLIKSYTGKEPEAKPHEKILEPAERKVNEFLESFEDNFLFISKARTHAWFLINIAFLVLGILTAVILFW